MKRNFFNMLNRAILDTQIDGKNILYFSGKFAGYEYAKVKKAKNIEELKRILNNIFKELSLGNVENIVKKYNKLIIKIRGNFDSKNYFICGFITGIVSNVLNYNFYKFTGKEIRYKSNGNYHTFEVTSI